MAVIVDSGALRRSQKASRKPATGETDSRSVWAAVRGRARKTKRQRTDRTRRTFSMNLPSGFEHPGHHRRGEMLVSRREVARESKSGTQFGEFGCGNQRLVYRQKPRPA